MERNSGKVMVACAIGAGIGSVTALELNAYLWWLGTLIGFMAGYLAYDFHKVIQAVPQAWRSARACLSWRPDDEFKNHCKITIKAFSQMFFGVFFVIMTGAIAISVILAILHVTPIFTILFIFSLFSSALALLASSTTIIANVMDSDFESLEKQGKECVSTLKRCNPISVYFYWLPIGSIWLCVTGVPMAFDFLASVVVAAGVFCKQLFILIHSELRLLCGVDAAVGATIGYACGNALLGIVAGALIGLLNYEIVSKRILHLVPNNN